MEESQNHPPKKERDVWDRWSISADVAHKILILIIGSFVAAGFFWYQQKQLDSRYFAELMAQRETAESQLRAQMFKTLFDAYFANKLQLKSMPEDQSSSESGTTGAGAAVPHPIITAKLEKLKRETMFTDLLSRNFESIDVRPLFEDLDNQLTSLLDPENKLTAVKHSLDKDERVEIFTLRERLRRIAFGASSRQITGLTGRASAKVSTHYITSCTDKKSGKVTISNVNPVFPYGSEAYPAIESMKDGTVMMSLVPLQKNDIQESNDLVDKAEFSHRVEPIHLQITFFDMPSFENIVLKSGERLAFTLSRYTSYNSCKEFQKQMDESLKSDCAGVLREEEQECDEAVIRITAFPKGFIGVRDRPYLNELDPKLLLHKK